MQLLDLQPAGHLVAAVERGADLGYQLAVLGLSREIPAAALDQLLLQPVLPVAVRALDGAVLMGDATVVAGGDHAQMGAELAVAAGEISRVAAVAVAIAGAEAVGAVLSRHSAAQHQSVLQRLGQGDKTLAAMDHLHMAPARIGQTKVEQPMLKRHTSDRDGLALEHREIGDPQHTWLVRLQEHHILSRPR